MVQESRGAVINLRGSYRVALGVGGLRPYGPSVGGGGVLHVNSGCRCSDIIKEAVVILGVSGQDGSNVHVRTHFN